MARDVGLVIGASSGLGEHVLRALSGRGLYPVASARRVERLTALAHELDGFAIPFDVSNTSSYASFSKTIDAVIQDQDASRLFVVYTPGFHELELLTTEQVSALSEPPDAALVRAMLGNAYDRMYDLNVAAPQRIIKLLQDVHIPVSFAYTSSQAADPQWHSQGNALYGPQKREMEQFLHKYSDMTMYALRYPFFRSDMGKAVFDQLSVWDKQLRTQGWDEVSVPVEDVALATAELLHSGGSERFERIERVVYTFRNN